MNILSEFQKRAAAAGLTEEQIASFVTENFTGHKTAEQQTDDVLGTILAEAGVTKSAESIAYLEGFLKQALNRGFSPDDAVVLSKEALAYTFPAAPVKQAAAETAPAPEQTAYFEGMFEKGAAIGLSRDETLAVVQKLASAMDLARGGGQWLSHAGGSGMELARSGGRALSQAGGEAGGGLGKKLLAGLGIGGAAAGAGYGVHSMLQQPGMMEQLQQWISQNPELAGGLGGAAVGGGAGALSGMAGPQDPNDPSAGESHVGRNALIGALAGGGAGAGAGAGAGHFGPDMFKKLQG